LFAGGDDPGVTSDVREPFAASHAGPGAVTLFLAGDVMLGRGIDQVQRHHSDPVLFEPHVRSATAYVKLAERRSGPIPSPVEPSYVWGDALPELERQRPGARIINLETSVTQSGDAWPDKPIHYRMHPLNVESLVAAHTDCCVLANNHVLDWGVAGLIETLDVLHAAGIRTAGAGHTGREAIAPAVIPAGGGVRVLVWSFGAASSGVPPDWSAADNQPGVAFLEDLSQATVRRLAALMGSSKRTGDLVVASIHWGGNWGYDLASEEREFAHGLIDQAGVDVVHGHSSHHPRGIEVYRGRLILYGCGDLLNDYEGIGGYEQFRGDLVLAYFPTVGRADGSLIELRMTPFRIGRFRLNRASRSEADWLGEVLSRAGRTLGTRVAVVGGGTLRLEWSRS
jgi:poly-gamma-glutamate synthesis protein (capsule biosynthesis protein)